MKSAIDRAALHSLVATSPDDDPRLREMDRILRVGTTATTPTRSLRTFNIKEAAQQANVSRATIYRAIEARVLRAGPLYAGGRKRVLEADLDAWLSKQERRS